MLEPDIPEWLIIVLIGLVIGSVMLMDYLSLHR